MSASNFWRRLTGWNSNTRWDSSDPDRAPPPLPLNPQSPSFSSRAGTSSAIQSAHAALSERARESGALVPTIAKRIDHSPDRSLVKAGSGHRRMQSMQPGSVRDLSLMIEGGSNSPSSSPTKSPKKEDLYHYQHNRESTPTPVRGRDMEKEPESVTVDKEFLNPGPLPGPSFTPIIRPTVRRPPPQSILGENTPPQSSTMLALQTMGSQQANTPKETSEPVLTNITNGSTGIPKQPQPQNPNLDQLSSQILSLTSIASSLQKEMSALSRRSRDNATDLLSLKEATNTRDEDIRKSLKDLISGVSETSFRLSSGQLGGLLLDNKPHNPSYSTRGFQLPRIPSPKSFSESIDRASVSTPSLYGSADGSSSSVALLEKIIRDMGTKEGQDTLVSRLGEVSLKLSGMATATKVDELLDHIKTQSQNAVVSTSQQGTHDDTEGQTRDLTHDRPVSNQVQRLFNNADSRRSSTPIGRGAEVLNDDLMKIIRSVKDSVAQGGGLTAEVKALVRELRGEVLGMGREIGKRLEQVGRKGIEETDSPSKDEVSRVIDEGLEQMKDQLNHVLREHRRQSAQSAATSKTLVDYQEIYNAMRAALRDNEASGAQVPDLSRDDVIDAVRDAWETYKPEIEVQQLGLERDEVLACLKEGLLEYAPRDEKPAGATRDEVFKAVVEGLKHFVPPQVETPATLSRDEIIEAVRDCLEEFEFPIAASAIGNDMTREEMVHAVREGLSDLDLPRGGALVPHSNNDEILSRLEDLVGYIKLEFKAVSQEAKDNVAANGRDTEQVLDATKDGLENLRMSIESYVDRVRGETGQEDFMHDLLKTMDDFKEDMTILMSQATDASREQLQTELEGLREIVNSSMVPATPPPSNINNNKEVLEALHSAVTSLRQEILRPRPETGEIIDALNEGLNEVRIGMDRFTNKPVDLTANDEILDALKSGLDSVRSDIESIRDENNNDRALAAVPKAREPEIEQAIIPVDMVKQDDIKNLEILITQLRIKVESLEPEPDSGHKEDLSRLEEMLRDVQKNVEEIGSREVPVAAAAVPPAPAPEAPALSPEAASKEDVEAIETILRNTKARIDDLLDSDQSIRKEHLEAIEALVLETRESMSSMADKIENGSGKEDLTTMGTLLAEVKSNLDDMAEKAQKEAESGERVSKTDVEAVETVVLEIKNILDVFQGVDLSTLPKKEDLDKMETLINETKEKLGEKLESFNEASSTALVKKDEELTMKDEEMNKVGERVTEVKTFLEEFQGTVKTKLDDGSSGIEALGKLLETMGTKIDKNEDVGTDLKEMFETMKTEFEDSKNVVAGAKLESDEKLQEATTSLGTKIDDKITELIAKYDAFQAILDQKAEAGEARDIETEAAVVGTKAIAEELKLLIDTLGSTVTESLEKMEEASKTVFGKVEELVSRNDEIHTEDKAEHQQTRDQLQQALTVVEGLAGEVNESNPKILEAIKEVMGLVTQHFEHSKTSTTDIQDKIIEAKPPEQPLLPAPEQYDDSEVQQKLDRLVELKYDDTELRERLDRLVEDKYDDATVLEKLDRLVEESKEFKYDDTMIREKLDQLAEAKYDDAVVNEKLDKLVTQGGAAEQAFAQLDTLDKVHQSVVKTAADISDFLSHQTQRITDEHEDREKTLQETLVSLERKRAEKDHLKASVLSLKDEEDRIRSSITCLRTEQESLIRQKTRLTGDVSSLETAMRLRKEELAEMEARADRLERRILEGVMDHSRVLLMSRATKNSADSMSRKRVRKPANDETAPTSKPAAKPVMNMALAGKRNLAPPAQTGAARRIASLGQINNNLPAGGVKRSQSVRSGAGSGKSYRKRSWGGDMGFGGGDSDLNKENLSVRETVEEVDETVPETVPEGGGPALLENGDAISEAPGDDESDAGTLRRSSMGTSVVTASDVYTASDVGYSEDGDAASQWTESVVSSSLEGNDAIGDDTGELVVYGQ